MNLERVVIELFGGCNYTCKMCPQSFPGRENNFLRRMPLDQFEEILDKITPKYGTPLINLEGSGEPTLVKDLPLYIEACTRRGLKTYIYSNGYRFSGQYMKDCVDAGLGLFRFSVIGYNRELYKKWMNVDNFEKIKENASSAMAYKKESNSDIEIQSYHLILDNDKVDYEIQQYRKNFIEELNVIGYIWKMHNWSGNYDPEYNRDTRKKRTCGRPGANELTVRAGGLNGHTAAVTPCCQVLGPPNESKSVLGHLDTESFEDVYWGEKYNELRHLHETEQFDKIDYCKNCDFLYEDNEVLAWTNSLHMKPGQMLGIDLKVKQ